MPAPVDYGLTEPQLSALEKASQWIAIGDIAPTHLRNLLLSTLSDAELARQFSTLSPHKVQSVLTYLQERRK